MTLLSSTSNNSLRTFECNYENPAFPTKTGSYGISKSWNRGWQQIPCLKKGFLQAIERQHSRQPRFIVTTGEIVTSRKISQSGIVFAFTTVAVLRAIPKSKQRIRNIESNFEGK